MSLPIPAALIGAPSTGFTAPVYNTTEDQSPDFNSKQVIVTSLGGTQTGVTTHTGNTPFTLAWLKPKVYQLLGRVNPLTGLISKFPANTWRAIVRKSMSVAVNQPPQIGILRISWEIPAGAESYDQANIKALLSAGHGAMYQMEDQIFSMIRDNSI